MQASSQAERELIAHYRDVRARMNGPAAPKPVVIKEHDLRTRLRLWRAQWTAAQESPGYDRPIGPPEFPRPRNMSPKQMIAEVAREHNCAVSELIGRRRIAEVVLARHEAMYRLRVEACLSLSRVGQIMDGRDHQTVWSGVRKHAQVNGLPIPTGPMR